jgi:UDP-N-acetylmuramate--alanine ligase
MLSLNRIKSIHFTGIKGVGMTALALCAQDLGKKISGSDTDETFPTSAILQARGIKSKIGFAPKNLPSNCDLLIFTGAHGGATNPEVIAAQKLSIPVLSHAEALALFTQNKQTIAVAGVGGKSTTSAITATVLDVAGLKPSFAVGVGNIPALGAPGRFVRKTPFFVVESDEYVTDPQTNLIPRFHHLDPFIAIITNLEHDHPDVYPTLADVFAAFKIFIDKVKPNGLVIVNIDNPRIRQLVADISRPVVSYGFSPQADWRLFRRTRLMKNNFSASDSKT